MDNIKKEKTGNLLPYVIIVMTIFILINTVTYYKIIIKNNTELTDTDTYMRLVRVEQLAETGNWYDSVIERSNYPDGDELHWTRPLDVILLGGACLLTPFQGFEKGLLTFGIIISPLLGIFSILAILWATKSVMKKNTQRLLMLLFIAQPLLLPAFLMGRPDHHGLIVLLFILFLGCLFKMAEEPKNPGFSLFCGLIAVLYWHLSPWEFCGLFTEKIMPVNFCASVQQRFAFVLFFYL